MTQGGVIALDDEKGGGRSVNYAEKCKKKKQSKWHSRAVLGRDKARVGLKIIFRGENVGGAVFRGPHFGAKMRPKSVQKRHAKIYQIEPRIFLEIGTDLGIIFGNFGGRDCDSI